MNITITNTRPTCISASEMKGETNIRVVSEIR